MANKRFYQFLYSKQPNLRLLTLSATFGSSGAVASSSGAGLYSFTKLAVGIYKVKLVDNYYAYLGNHASIRSAVAGASVTAGSFVVDTLYQITALGNTSWSAIGLDSDYTAAVGQPFVATGVGAGTGTAKAIAPSGITNIEISEDPASQLQNLYTAQGKGSAFIIQTFGLPASGQAPALASPASGSILDLQLWFRDSSVGAY
jgi:hypothetical protein